jgi:hypothetical protein
MLQHKDIARLLCSNFAVIFKLNLTLISEFYRIQTAVIVIVNPRIVVVLIVGK